MNPVNPGNSRIKYDLHLQKGSRLRSNGRQNQSSASGRDPRLLLLAHVWPPPCHAFAFAAAVPLCSVFPAFVTSRHHHWFSRSCLEIFSPL